MAEAYPDFLLRLPNGGPVARGRLLSERGAKGSRKFVVLAGSPVRAETVPSFAVRKPPSYRRRQQLIEEGAVRESERWPGWLETIEDLEFTSPSGAAEILMGCSTNGWGAWKSVTITKCFNTRPQPIKSSSGGTQLPMSQQPLLDCVECELWAGVTPPGGGGKVFEPPTPIADRRAPYASEPGHLSERTKTRSSRCVMLPFLKPTPCRAT
ncbi:DUF4357 domain-containing protein [Streptomyces sp. NPDC054804]